MNFVDFLHKSGTSPNKPHTTLKAVADFEVSLWQYTECPI